MKRLTGVAGVVSDFRVTQPPLLSGFLELSLTLGITAHPEETDSHHSGGQRHLSPGPGRQRSATHTVTHTGFRTQEP